jgi:hypothetical protein
MYYYKNSAIRICEMCISDEDCLNKLKNNINDVDFFESNIYGYKALGKAIERNFLISFKFLLKYFDVNEYNGCLTFLHLAVLYQKQTIVEILLNQPKINIYNRAKNIHTYWSGWTAEELHFNHRINLSSPKYEIGDLLKQARIKDRKKFHNTVLTLTYCLCRWQEVNVPMEMIRAISRMLRPNKGLPKSLWNQ